MKKRAWLFVVYLIVALYIFNNALSFVAIPDVFKFLNKYILIFGSVLILITGLKYLGIGRH